MQAARARALRIGTAAVLLTALISSLPSAQVSRPTVAPTTAGDELPYRDPALPVEQRVEDLLGRMTRVEKVGQMTQADRAAVAGEPTLVAERGLGSVLSGGGSTPSPNTPAAWLEMVNGFQRQAMGTRLRIPLIYGVDAVHGHGNVHGATIFPHNVGLGATRDPELVARVGHAIATEVRATGVPWNFAPCLCVTRDERWGRTYESFGEDPALVIAMETIIDGMQSERQDQLADHDRVLATGKHYAGDGDTEYDPRIAAQNRRGPRPEEPPRFPIDRGVTVTSRRDFDRIDLHPYREAVKAHELGSVMASYSSVDWIDDGMGEPTNLHANRELITGVLKGELGFPGFVVSDWEGIHRIPDPDHPTEGLTPYRVRVGVNAGIDMFMEPFSARQFQDLLLAEVAAGRVGQPRLDDAVRRILRAKLQLGLFDNPYATTDHLDRVGSTEHRTTAREAVAESQVLLKNDGGVLPLSAEASIYLAGRSADDIGNQSGGWTITWQGSSGDIVPGTTILQGIRQVAPRASVTYSPDASASMTGSDVGVVVVGETPYAEGHGDVGGPECLSCPPPRQAPEQRSLRLQPADRAAVDAVCDAIETCVVIVVSGRPQLLTDQLSRIDALVAAWLPGSEGIGVADVLFGERPFQGRLPITWPREESQVPIDVGDAYYQPLYPFGWGLRTGSLNDRLQAAADAAGNDPATRRASPHLDRALADPLWRPDGGVRDPAAVLDQLGQALAALGRPEPFPLSDAIVSVARDLAQATVIADRAPADWAALVANAEHTLLTGDPAGAFALLVRVAGASGHE